MKRIYRSGWAVALCLCLGAMFAHLGPGSAQERTKGKAGAPQIGSDLRANDRQLMSIEGLVRQIEAAKTSAAKDRLADTLETSVAAYARAMVASFNAAIKQAEQGNVESLKSFEEHATNHENRLKQLDERGQKMAPRSGLIQEPAKAGKAALGWLLETIGDFLISPAQAAIALSVYNACHQNPPNQAACASAVAGGPGQVSAAYATFNNCWNSLDGVRPKWWRAIRRAGCAAALTARLA